VETLGNSTGCCILTVLRFFILGFALLTLGGCTRTAPERPVPKTLRVAAASDLSMVFTELGPRFTGKSGIPVVFTFGSTGLLAHQIRNGAPFDVFAAANVSFVDNVIAAGSCEADSKALYARGRIVLLPYANIDLATLGDLRDPRFHRIAIANPGHAPYGLAAKQALEASGLWSAVEPRLVYGENISQALQFVESGNAEAGFVALSLIRGAAKERMVLIDESLHAPINQALAVCLHGQQTEGGRAFAAFLATPESRQTMADYGFRLPADEAR
jgi:molybdate transport system substrate-binding protein